MEVVMLEKYFLKPSTVDRIRAHWLAPQIERYVEWMQAQGYADRSILRRVPQNQALTRRVLAARLRGAACVENIDYRAERGLNRSVIRGLAQESSWVANHEHIFVLGPTGVGKSYVASALAQKACRDGYRVYYTRAAALFRDLSLARADGSLRQLLRRLNRIDVLVIDDWVMAPMSEAERRDFWEIAEDRYQTRSMILTSQLPVSRWHEQIGDPTLADGILDRLVHNAHRIEMRGDSIRKQKGVKEEK
jgi:DNA replication protein DnaC